VKPLLFGLLCLLPLAAVAQAPERSLRPLASPRVLAAPATPPVAADPAAEPSARAAGPAPKLRPLARPEAALAAIATAPRDPARAETMGVTRELPPTPDGIQISRRPKARPGDIRTLARVQQSAPPSPKVAQVKGQICGDPALQGIVVGRVTAGLSACGIDNAVRVQSVRGVKLSTSALMDCNTATAVRTWVDKGLLPVVGNYGGGVSGLQIAGSYACRTRNHVKGARISEHGKGHAIDIAAIRLRDGSTLSVLNDWGKGKKGRILKASHAAGCQIFGTTLGPESDAQHRNHFHFDTAPRSRGVGYCR
tara:strand:- start:6939 stop:7862 length:924 start_codon:yes stop_codon:yes gene_type:complete